MKQWTAKIAVALAVTFMVVNLVSEFIDNDPIHYFEKHPSELLRAAGIAIAGGLIAFLYDRMSMRQQRSMKLLVLGSAAVFVAGFAACFMFTFSRIWPLFGTYELKYLIILIPLCLSIVIALVCLEFYEVFKRRPERIVVTEDSVTRFRTDGDQEVVRWSDLSEVGIVTMDKGPKVEVVFLLLSGHDEKTACEVSQGADGADKLLEAIQKLPGIDNEAVVKALGSTSHARFVCWRKNVQPAN